MRLSTTLAVAGGVAVLLTAAPARGPAQTADRSDSAAARTLVLPATPDDERLRLAQLLGRTSTAGYLLRSPSATLGPLASGAPALHVAVLQPQLLMLTNSELPFSLNTGALWAGRGVSAALTAGVRAERGRFSLVLAPQLLYEQNRPFIRPKYYDAPAQRSSFAHPFHGRPASMDLPLRFGDRTRVLVDPGQSSFTVRVGAVAAGVATESRWWGPGVRNAIVLSSNAPGFGHVFVRTTRPLRTRAGAFEAVLLAGGLSESGYFDSTTANDRRSFSGMAVTFRPHADSGFTAGFARAVYAPVRNWTTVPFRILDALYKPVGTPNSVPESDTNFVAGPDQVWSLFARYVLPQDHFEAYVEWARYEFPQSIRALLTAPGHTQGYTLGLQWAKPVGRSGAAVRVQAEHTYLEQDPSYADMPIGSWYTSRRMDQGYTQRGKVIGAAIGPGASSHFFAVDFVASRAEGGVFFGRIRWDDDNLYRIKGTNINWNTWCSHDVSIFAGFRGAFASRFGRASASLTLAQRWNVYFEHDTGCGEDLDRTKITDKRNTTFELRFAPRLR